MKKLLYLLLAAIVMYGCNTPQSYYAFKRVKAPEKKEFNENTDVSGESIVIDEEELASLIKEIGDEEVKLYASAIEDYASKDDVIKLRKNAEKVFKNEIQTSPEKKQRLTLSDLKTAIEVKKELKKVEKEINENEAAGDPKSQLVATLLAFIVGALGIHRFYLGYTTIGIIQLLTAGGCGVWALIDLIRIILGDLKPADGSDYDPKF